MANDALLLTHVGCLEQSFSFGTESVRRIRANSSIELDNHDDVHVHVRVPCI